MEWASGLHLLNCPTLTLNTRFVSAQPFWSVVSSCDLFLLSLFLTSCLTHWCSRYFECSVPLKHSSYWGFRGSKLCMLDKKDCCSQCPNHAQMYASMHTRNQTHLCLTPLTFSSPEGFDFQPLVNSLANACTVWLFSARMYLHVCLNLCLL